MNDTKYSRIGIYLGPVLAVLATVLMAQPTFAGHGWILLHHEDQGQGQPAFEQCMPVESWEGHGGHVGDWFLGPYDNDDCVPTDDEPTATPVPTNEPTGEPTDGPTGEPTDGPTDEPTNEPTDEPTQEPTDEPTPTDLGPTPTPPGPVPTDAPPTGSPEPPVVADRLPDTGDGLSADPWLCYGTNVWCAHNGVDGSPGEQWVFLHPGATVTHDGITYTVAYVGRVPASQVSVLDDAGDYDLVLLTCTNYDGYVWLERVVVKLVLP